MQTEVTVEQKLDKEQLVDKFGVWIGQDEWNEVLDWSKNAQELFSSYQEGKIKVPDEEKNELMLQSEYALAIRNLKWYYTIVPDGFSEYWIVNPKPVEYLVANKNKKIVGKNASYSDLLVFLVLGIARGIWTAVDARYHLTSECTTAKFLSSR